MSVTTTVRDIDELLPVAQKAIRLLFQELYKAGINVFVTETYRSQERQNYLYAQGRTRSGSIVTWTTSSRHKSRLAWDLAASQVNGNSNIYNATTLKKAGAVALKLGITWGGQASWVKAGATDLPHFEVSSNWTIPKGYSLNSTVSIPTSSTGLIKLVSSVSNLTNVGTVIDDSKLEEDLKLDKNFATIKDITSPSLRNAVISKLEKATKSKKLSDSKWLTAAENGTLPLHDLVALLSYIED